MVGIRSPRFAPTLLKYPPHGVVKYFLGCAAGSSILPYRLLGQDGRDGSCLPHGPQVAGGRQTQPIAAAGRLFEAQQLRAQPGEAFPQGGGVGRGQGADPYLARVLSFKTGRVAGNAQHLATVAPGQTVARAMRLNLGAGIDHQVVGQ